MPESGHAQYQINVYVGTQRVRGVGDSGTSAGRLPRKGRGLHMGGVVGLLAHGAAGGFARGPCMHGRD